MLLMKIRYFFDSMQKIFQDENSWNIFISTTFDRIGSAVVIHSGKRE